MGYKDKRYIFLTIDGEYITLLRSRKSRSQWEIVEYKTNHYPFQQESQVQGENLSSILGPPSAKEDCYLILPRHEITAKVVTLPSQNIDEIKNMVALSAEEYVPYSAEEIYTTQTVLRKLPNSESEVLIVIAHKELVQGKIDILKRMGLEPKGIVVSTGAIIASIPSLRRTTIYTQETFGIVHITHNGIEVALFNKERLLSSRGVQCQWNAFKPKTEPTQVAEPQSVLNPFSISSSIDTEPWSESLQNVNTSTDPITEIYREVISSINAYQRETETEFSPSAIYISADFPIPDQEVRTLEAKLAIPCYVLNAQSIPFQCTEQIHPPISLPLVSCALSIAEPFPLELDLLPDELRQTYAIRETVYHLKHCAILLIVLCFSLLGLFVQNVWQREKFIKELSQQIAEIEGSARGVAEMRQQLQILRREVAKNGSALDFLSKITEVAHPNVNINTYSYRRNEGINLWGRARTVDDVHTFADNLRKQALKTTLKAFSQARSVYEQRVTEYNQMIFDYQITIPFVEEETPSGTSTATTE